jgi:hypothetical protein
VARIPLVCYHPSEVVAPLRRRRRWNALGWQGTIERAADAGKIVNRPDQLGQSAPIPQQPTQYDDEPSLLAVIVTNVLAYAAAYFLFFVVIIGCMYYFLRR